MLRLIKIVYDKILILLSIYLLVIAHSDIKFLILSIIAIIYSGYVIVKELFLEKTNH